MCEGLRQCKRQVAAIRLRLSLIERSKRRCRTLASLAGRAAGQWTLSPHYVQNARGAYLVAFMLAFEPLQPLLFFFMAGLLMHFECVLGA